MTQQRDLKFKVTFMDAADVKNIEAIRDNPSSTKETVILANACLTLGKTAEGLWDIIDTFFKQGAISIDPRE
jgi:hypothetical protein